MTDAASVAAADYESDDTESDDNLKLAICLEEEGDSSGMSSDQEVPQAAGQDAGHETPPPGTINAASSRDLYVQREMDRIVKYVAKRDDDNRDDDVENDGNVSPATNKERQYVANMYHPVHYGQDVDRRVHRDVSPSNEYCKGTCAVNIML